MFPERMRALRTGARLSLPELAKELNAMAVPYAKRKKTASQIGKWERGTTTPSYLEVRQLAEYFGVSLDYLSGRSYDGFDLSELFSSSAQLTFQMKNLNATARAEIYALIKGYLSGRAQAKYPEEFNLELELDEQTHA